MRVNMLVYIIISIEQGIGEAISFANVVPGMWKWQENITYTYLRKGVIVAFPLCCFSKSTFWQGISIKSAEDME